MLRHICHRLKLRNGLKFCGESGLWFFFTKIALSSEIPSYAELSWPV